MHYVYFYAEKSAICIIFLLLLQKKKLQLVYVDTKEVNKGKIGVKIKL